MHSRWYQLWQWGLDYSSSNFIGQRKSVEEQYLRESSAKDHSKDMKNISNTAPCISGMPPMSPGWHSGLSSCETTWINWNCHHSRKQNVITLPAWRHSWSQKWVTTNLPCCSACSVEFRTILHWTSFAQQQQSESIQLQSNDQFTCSNHSPDLNSTTQWVHFEKSSQIRPPLFTTNSLISSRTTCI